MTPHAFSDNVVATKNYLKPGTWVQNPNIETHSPIDRTIATLNGSGFFFSVCSKRQVLDFYGGFIWIIPQFQIPLRDKRFIVSLAGSVADTTNMVLVGFRIFFLQLFPCFLHIFVLNWWGKRLTHQFLSWKAWALSFCSKFWIWVLQVLKIKSLSVFFSLFLCACPILLCSCHLH